MYHKLRFFFNFYYLDLIITQLRDYEIGVWIGFTILREGTWLWTDNSQVGYTNWFPREPSGVILLILFILNNQFKLIALYRPSTRHLINLYNQFIILQMLEARYIFRYATVVYPFEYKIISQ